MIPGGPADSAHLPGGFLLIHNRMIESAPAPEATAGVLLVEAARADAADPLTDLLRGAGIGATFALLTRGEISDAAIAAHADGLLARPPVTPPEDRLQARFAAAQVPARPYQQMPGAVAFAAPAVAADAPPVLEDADWLRLQAICTR